MHSPLRCEVLGQVAHAGLADVVSRLWLRIVGGVCGDGGREENGATSSRGDHVASGGLGAEEGAVEIDVDDLLELVGGGGDGGDTADYAGEAD